MQNEVKWFTVDERLPDNDGFMLVKVWDAYKNTITIENAYLHAKHRCWVLAGGVLVEKQYRNVFAWRDPLAPYAPRDQ
jgi:hypothetical protein